MLRFPYIRRPSTFLIYFNISIILSVLLRPPLHRVVVDHAPPPRFGGTSPFTPGSRAANERPRAFRRPDTATSAPSVTAPGIGGRKALAFLGPAVAGPDTGTGVLAAVSTAAGAPLAVVDVVAVTIAPVDVVLDAVDVTAAPDDGGPAASLPTPVVCASGPLVARLAGAPTDSSSDVVVADADMAPSDPDAVSPDPVDARDLCTSAAAANPLGKLASVTYL